MEASKLLCSRSLPGPGPYSSPFLRNFDSHICRPGAQAFQSTCTRTRCNHMSASTRSSVVSDAGEEEREREGQDTPRSHLWLTSTHHPSNRKTHTGGTCSTRRFDPVFILACDGHPQRSPSSFQRPAPPSSSSPSSLVSYLRRRRVGISAHIRFEETKA